MVGLHLALLLPFVKFTYIPEVVVHSDETMEANVSIEPN